MNTNAAGPKALATLLGALVALMGLAFAAFAALTLGVTSAEAATGATYSVTDIGTFSGGNGDAFDVNATGQVVGRSDVGSGVDHAFLWENGQTKDLGTLGGTTSIARAISDSVQVVGSATTSSGQNHAFLWTNGQMKDLGTLGGAQSTASDINNKGQIVGTSDTIISGQNHVFLWENGQMKDLGGLGTLSGTSPTAVGINDNGQIVGQLTTSDGSNARHAFLWENGQTKDLGTLGGTTSRAYGINNNGQVVGYSETSDGRNHAFLWENGQMQDLGTLGGIAPGNNPDSWAWAINDSGQVVGQAYTSAGYHAFLWENGQMQDLDYLKPQESGFGFLGAAQGVNNVGQIVGNGIKDGNSHGFLMTPLDATPPPPSSSPGRIVFDSDRDGNQGLEIYTMDPTDSDHDGNGDNLTRLTNSPGNDMVPDISRDGKKITFVSTRDYGGNNEIYVMDATDSDGDGNGDNLTRLTNNQSFDHNAVLSPDGKRVAFISDRNSSNYNDDIYVMDTTDSDGDGNGDNLTRLTSSAENTQPEFSPDGKRIVFTSNRDDPNGSHSDVYVMDATDSDGDGNGDNLTRLTNNGQIDDSCPEFSPDGKKVAFCSTRSEDEGDIWVMDATDSDGDGNGDNPTRLTNDAAQDTDAAFSPDGKRIAFSRWTAYSSDPVDTNPQIFVMDAVDLDGDGNGDNLVRLTNVPSQASRAPSWGGSAGSDTTPPHLGLPADIITEATGPAGALANYSATATDDVDGSVSVDCKPVSGTTFPIGTTTVNCSATDRAGNTANGSFKVTVQDTTAPQLNLPQDKVVEATGPDGAKVRYAASANDAVDGAVAVDCQPASDGVFPLGTTAVSCSAKDAAGNQATGSFKVTVQDTTAPAITGVPADMTAQATSSSGALVAYASPTANDAVDGAVKAGCSPASGTPFPIGTTSVACSATDAHGNKASASFKVSVLYGFKGFYDPVDNPPTFNVAKASVGVPVIFSLSGNMGLSIFETGYPKVVPIACDPTAPVDAIERTVSVKSSSLTYDAKQNLYGYAWKTNSTWAGTCQQLVMRFKDGTERKALFKFTK